MTRRLVVAIVSMVIAAIALTAVGTFILSTAAARRDDERALRAASVEMSKAMADSELTVVQRALLNPNIREVLKLDGTSFLRVAPSGRLDGELPTGVAELDLAPVRVADDVTVSGRRGRLVWSATSVEGPRSQRFIAVVTRNSSSGFATALRWFVLSSVLVIAAGALVALSLGRRLTRPIREAEAAAHRIADGELSTRLADSGGSDEFADLARSVNTMAASLERSKAVEQQFLLSITHDLRTPLTSIRGYAEAITDGATADPKWAAGVITTEAGRLERLVGDLLDLAKLQSRSFALVPRRTDLTALAGDIASGLAADTPEVSVASVASTPVWADVDPDRLAQVVGNLVTNAKKFARTSITVGTASDQGHALLWVDDDGPGIPLAERAHVFERLYVTGQKPLRQENSSGLGLAIVSELVRAMGGTVRVEDSPAGGARFVIAVPEAAALGA